MAIYVVLSDRPSPKLQANIEKEFPGDSHFLIAPNQWLISSDKVGQTISNELSLPTNGVDAKAVVFRTTGAGWGWHSKALWEWLSVKSAEG